MVIDEQHTVADGEPTETEDPAGGVTIPLSRREIARAYALAGIVVGASAILGVLYTADTSSLNHVNV